MRHKFSHIEVVNKRRVDEMEDNPARRNLRYEVHCQPAGAANASK